MKIRDFPPMQAALDDLATIIPLLNDAFEAGVDYARGQCDGLRSQFGGPAYDPWFFSHCVRQFVKRMLSQRGLSIEEWKPDDVPMSGLRFRYRDWFVRTRKANRLGGLPGPGKSLASCSYYQQMLPGEFGIFSGRNVIFIWHATRQAEYTGLSLVYPLSGDSESPTVYWRRDFPANALLLRKAQPLQLDPEALGDLDMELSSGSDEEINGEELAR